MPWHATTLELYHKIEIQVGGKSLLIGLHGLSNFIALTQLWVQNIQLILKKLKKNLYSLNNRNNSIIIVDVV